jgi:hypothetical protein
MTALAVPRDRTQVEFAQRGWERWALPVVLVLHLLLGTVWSFSVPLGEGPDEPAHFQYVLFLHHEGRLPVQSGQPRSTDVSGEAHQPPLAYLVMQPFVAWLPPAQSVPTLFTNPNFRWSGGTEPNAFLHRGSVWPPYQGVALAWHLARLVSVVLGTITVALCYATIRRLWPEPRGLALGGAALVAFNPQWIFNHALVSNDPLLITLGSLLVYCSVVVTQRTYAVGARPRAVWSMHEWGWALLAGVALGLMLITKQSALALLPVPLLGLFLARRNGIQWALQSLVLVAVAVAVAGWWYLRNLTIYGDLMGLRTFKAEFEGGGFQLGSWAGWREGGWSLLRSSLALFGWMTVPLPDGVYLIFRAVLVVAGAGLLASIGRGVWDGRGRAAVVIVASVALMFGWTIAFAVTTRTVGWPGRYLFPAAPAFATLLAVGLANALPRRVGLVSLSSVCLALAVVLPPGVIATAYASPVLTASEVPRRGPYARLDFGWKRAFELHDATFPRSAKSGATVPLAFTWHLVEQVNRSYTVFVHLVDQQKNILAKTDMEPLGGRPATNAWLPGDWYRDHQQLALVGVAPGIYHLRVGLFDTEQGERLGIYDRDGTLIGDSVDLGEFRVEEGR